MPFTPEKWGPENTSQDYEFMMEGETPVSQLISLVGHALTSPAQDLTDPVTVPSVRKVGGRIKRFTKTIRPAEQTSQTFTILFGSSLWTPALQRARSTGACPTKFYAVRLCPDEPQYQHAYIYPEAILNPPVRANDFITIEDVTPVDWQTEMRVEQELILYYLGGFLKTDTATPFYAVGFLSEDCASCSSGVQYSDAIAVGGIGGGADPLIIVRTDDRFASVDNVTNPGPVGHVGVALYTLGDVALAGFRDDPAYATSVTGGTLFSNDGGLTFTIDSNITVPVNGVGFFGGEYIAVGGIGGGQAILWTSTTGISWTSIASANLPATSAALAVAVDEEKGRIYITCEDGILLKGLSQAGSITLEDISANLPGAPGDLLAVAVLAPDHIAVGGASGYYAESFDGGTTWEEPAVPGTAIIYAIAGTDNQSLLGAGAVFYKRNALTAMGYSAVVLENGATITGDVRGVAKALDEFNWFLGVTDDGEIVSFSPMFPNA
jgi:hypothetical protein